MTVQQDLSGRVGRYRIVRKLGEGGMGAVYLAEDEKLGRRVALKVPRFDPAAPADAIERFQREVRIAVGIEHPNLCPVHDVDVVDGVPFFTMPVIEGVPLSRAIETSGPWPSVQAVRLVRKIALALAVLHRNGFVHRDLKPGNIIVRDTGEPVLLDFGLARSFASGDDVLTLAGQEVMGSPPYMAPEQLGHDVPPGPATDVYGLGMVLFQLLTGRVAFDGTPSAILGKILTQPAPPPSSIRDGIEPELDDVCLKALAKLPEERFASVQEFAEALTRFLDDPSRGQNIASVPDRKFAPSGVGMGSYATDGPRAPADRTVPVSRGFPRVVGMALVGGILGLLVWGLVLLTRTENDSVENQVGSDRPEKDKDRKPPGDRPIETVEKPVVPPPPKPLLNLIVDRERIVRAGEKIALPVGVERLQCVGAVQLTLEGDVRQVAMQGGLIEAASDTGSVVLTVDAKATPGVRSVRFKGEAGKAKAQAELKLTVIRASPPEEIVNGLGMKLKLIRAGRFVMGSPDGKSGAMKEASRDEDEGPQHEIRIERPFYMSSTETTIRQFQEFVEQKNYRTDAEKGRDPFHWKRPGIELRQDHPMVFVSWNDATAFCRWLSDKEGRLYDLPTEAEWEYACRAGTTTAYHVGPRLDSKDAAFKESNLKAPAKAASFAANAWGLHDMHGNVWEWCADGKRDYRKAPVEGGPVEGKNRMLRGGSWEVEPEKCRAARRRDAPPSIRSRDIGFRVVCRIED